MTGMSTTSDRSAEERMRLSSSEIRVAPAYPSRTPPNAPTARYLGAEGCRVVADRLEGDMRTTSTGESSPSSLLT